jgi:hypothetical protein
MSEFDFADLLTDQQKASIADRRVSELAAALYLQRLNLDSLVSAVPDAPTRNEDRAISDLTKAITSIIEAVSDLDVDLDEFEALKRASNL